MNVLCMKRGLDYYMTPCQGNRDVGEEHTDPHTLIYASLSDQKRKDIDPKAIQSLFRKLMNTSEAI